MLPPVIQAIAASPLLVSLLALACGIVALQRSGLLVSRQFSHLVHPLDRL